MASSKFALFKYDLSDNVGDNIQSLAIGQHVKNVDLFIDRDSLNTYAGDDCVVVMNGWFSHRVKNWPPSEAIHPIFFGFHMTREAMNSYKDHIDYFKRHEPIGCRDPETAKVLREWGVDSYVSGCATMTFPKRTEEPINGADILVDVSKKTFHRRDRQNMTEVNHTIANVDSQSKHAYAKGLLDYYKARARSVITSRIHCAMPCAAMGIPVAYIGIKEYRTDVLGLIGINYTPDKSIRKLRLEDLRMFSSDFEKTKKSLLADLRSRLSTAGVDLADNDF